MSKSKVVGELKELKNVIHEIKRKNVEMKLLRIKKKELEENIMEFLRLEEQPGVKFEDIVVLSKERTTCKKLKKTEKEENAIVVLENLGISNPKEALTSILDSMKGESIVVESLQFKESVRDL